MQAGAVPTSLLLVLPRCEDSAPSLEFPAKRRERRDLMGGLSDPLAQHPKETRPDACGAGFSRRRDELTDDVQGQPERLCLANELQPVEIGLTVETVAGCLAPAGR